jgi:hypothetical protein
MVGHSNGKWDSIITISTSRKKTTKDISMVIMNFVALVEDFMDVNK